VKRAQREKRARPDERTVPPSETVREDARGIVVPGHNAWKVARAERFRCVQDGEEYFRLVHAAILQAQHSVFILGWDISATVDLLPGSEPRAEPTRLAALLDFVVRRRRGLHCYVLIWNSSPVYALERDPFTKLRFGWGTHRRVHFSFDDEHPLAASHHQKVVVIDDRLAFSGGLDLTGHRWDIPSHPAEHPLRKDAMGRLYTPFHDVQALVEGPVAESLGELARDRWRRSGRRAAVHARPRRDESLWPAVVEADMTDVDVAISRTEPRFRGRPPVHECEKLFFDSIAAARRSIYLENQYFSNPRIADALAARLREPDGPEVVAVGPKECSGWLEEKTMGVLRQVVLVKLIDADLHGRLRLLHAVASREKCVGTFVHSKIMVIDDEFLRIGSANLSSRSMGMDTECDLSVDARGDPRIQAGIARVRDRLVGEHLDASAETVRRAREEHGSLRGATDALSCGEHCLEPIEVDRESAASASQMVLGVADPYEPMDLTRSFDRLLPEIVADDQGSGRIAPGLQLSALLILGVLAWRAREVAQELGISGLEELLLLERQGFGVVVGATTIFALFTLLFVPIEVLVLGAAVLFGPWIGGGIAVVGTIVSALLGYALGRALGPKRVAAVIGARAYALLRELRARGESTVALLRLLHLKSAMSVHLVSGAARVRLREFVRGTALGALPGTLALLILGGLLRRTILHPGFWTATLTIAFAAALAYFLLRRRRSLIERHVGAATQEQEGRARFG